MKINYRAGFFVTVLGCSLSITQLLHSQVSPCVSPPSGLVAWYRAENNANDETGNNNGTIVNSLGFTTGEVNQGFDFPGTNGYVTIPASVSLNVGTNSGLTIEGWIKPTDLSSQRPLVEWNDGTTPGVHFWINVSAFGIGGPGSLFANIREVGGTSHPLVSADNILSTNDFQHVAVTYDQSTGTATLYLNGVSVASDNLGSFTPETSSNVLLGKRLGGLPGDFFVGTMDEMSIYNRALSDCEIQSIYLVGMQGKCH